MLTHDQLQDQCKLIKRMLEVSSYFNGVTVTVSKHDGNTDVFEFGGNLFIEVRYDPGGVHRYLPGYNKTYANTSTTEQVYTGQDRSLHGAVVNLVTWMFMEQLQLTMDTWTTKDSCNTELEVLRSV